MNDDAERQRLQGDQADAWRRWGPYLSERAWGTVREDYSADGDAWDYFPHDHARSRAYRWNEDGLAGICDDRQRLCFALAFWNGAIRSSRSASFGLTGPRGQPRRGRQGVLVVPRLHARRTRGCAGATSTRSAPSRTPTSSRRTRRRGAHDPEYELLDTGVFDEDRYFDVAVDYAKAGAGRHLHPDHASTNRGPGRRDAARAADALVPRHLDLAAAGGAAPPITASTAARSSPGTRELGTMVLASDGDAEALFCDNETNTERLWGQPGPRLPEGRHQRPRRRTAPRP